MDTLVPMPKAALGDFSSDAALFSAYWQQVDERLRRLPAKPKRDTAATEIAEIIKQAARDARFIFLWRDPRENLGSIMDAWHAGGWVTYRALPGWDGPWSLLLPPGSVRCSST